jgi:hypothetical protein
MELNESADRITFLIRDRDILHPPSSDELPASAGIRTVRSAIRAPRTNTITVTITERWIEDSRQAQGASTVARPRPGSARAP